MKISLTNNAQRKLEKLPKGSEKKVLKKLLILEINPFSGKKLQGEMTGAYSLRAWPYRIIYTVNTKKDLLEVINIEHRQGVYN